MRNPDLLAEQLRPGDALRLHRSAYRDDDTASLLGISCPMHLGSGGIRMVLELAQVMIEVGDHMVFDPAATFARRCKLPKISQRLGPLPLCGPHRAIDGDLQRPVRQRRIRSLYERATAEHAHHSCSPIAGSRPMPATASAACMTRL
jgi:hypothetical protein